MCTHLKRAITPCSHVSLGTWPNLARPYVRLASSWAPYLGSLQCVPVCAHAFPRGSACDTVRAVASGPAWATTEACTIQANHPCPGISPHSVASVQYAPAILSGHASHVLAPCIRLQARALQPGAWRHMARTPQRSNQTRKRLRPKAPQPRLRPLHNGRQQ